MKMAKANEADLRAAMELCGAFDALTNRWGATVPEMIERPEGTSETEHFDRDDADQCVRVLGYLLDVANRASLMRVVWGCCVMLDPRNKCVDPDADVIEHHPDAAYGMLAKQARPLDEWEEDMGAVLWWRFPVDEAPYIGHPNCDDWPNYQTHWTPLVVPDEPVPKAKLAAQDPVFPGEEA